MPSPVYFVALGSDGATYKWPPRPESRFLALSRFLENMMAPKMTSPTMMAISEYAMIILVSIVLLRLRLTQIDSSARRVLTRSMLHQRMKCGEVPETDAFCPEPPVWAMDGRVGAGHIPAMR
jgi:hypothetical protein